ncbi:SDR family NAD(P)-dependent oxidoreductase [Nocardia sp. NPDC050406]|uniref:SDR family NAD(P)-dependent oxidoreductase n=1 Tax=Nocardia sp. NPDC050406 TaxID=3364318 RepID=UPI00378FB241
MANIVMTGGTSGFGAIAAERLVAAGDNRLLVGARRTVPAGEAIPLELRELDSARMFAATVRERLGGSPIDALVLNAGVIRPDADDRTLDGFETTFAVNHLAQYLVSRLLLPDLAETAIVILTTSGTHDPATGASLVPPRHADAELLAHPERDPDRDSRPRKAGEHAYTASKLCAVLTARSLSEQREGLTALAYDPGQVFGTGLAKNLSLPLRTAWSLFGTPLGWPLRQFSPTMNTRHAAGKALADLALRVTPPPPGHLYAALRRGHLTWPDLSDLARDDKRALALWTDSAGLVGLPD